MMQVGAVFGLIFALIVMAFVIYFGSTQLVNIMCLGNVGQTNNVVKNLENLVDDIQASGEGSSDTFRMSIPSNAKVCFLDPSDPSCSLAGDWWPDPEFYPIIETKIQTGGYNVWIEYNCGSSDDGYRMDYAVTDSNFCASSGDTLLLTNIGIEVRVEMFTG
jgi:hypothetical protein